MHHQPSAGVMNIGICGISLNQRARSVMSARLSRLTWPCASGAQLSIEDNELTSLAGIEPLVSLMELYAGG